MSPEIFGNATVSTSSDLGSFGDETNLEQNRNICWRHNQMTLFLLFVREVIRFAALLPVAFYFRNGSRIFLFVSLGTSDAPTGREVSFANRLLRYVPAAKRKRGRENDAHVCLPMLQPFPQINFQVEKRLFTQYLYNTDTLHQIDDTRIVRVQ